MTAPSVTPIAAPDAAEYERLRTDAGSVDRSDRLRMTFTGAKAAETLTGLVTNDVLALEPGHGAYAAALTVKGRIVADLRIFRRAGDDFLVDVPPTASAGFLAMVIKYVNPRLARYADVSADLACLGVVGPHARQVIAHALGTSPSEFDLLPAYAHAGVPFRDGAVMVTRSPDYGVDGFDCFVRVADAAALRASLGESGAAPADADALDVLRIEAGRPVWGRDMTDDTLAQEANLDALQAISYTKGCYTGQETVARLHFRGHVNRYLRGLRAEAMPEGPVVVLAGDREVGDVRSRGISPQFGAIALAMIRREVETGATVTLRAGAVESTATVIDLPFVP
ncbi:MAG: CAF17-like 4Fe-4S cluster assembly/insertion protein YgfZ [Gemmatimonadaceae bacterium]